VNEINNLKSGDVTMEVRMSRIKVSGSFAQAKKAAETFMTGVILKGGTIISNQYIEGEGLFNVDGDQVFVITYTVLSAVPTKEEK
jgi:hypothetical protein